MDVLDRLLLRRIEAHRRLAQAAPAGPEWDAAAAYLEEVEDRLRHLRTRPVAPVAV